MSPTRRPTRLTDGRIDPPVIVPATAVYNYPATELDSLEALWTGPRAALAAALRAEGAYLENAHWDWRAKKDRVASGALVLIAVEVENAVQGLLAVARSHRPAILSPGDFVADVDYIEAAPRNVRAASHPPRFLGVGTALVTEAVLLSAGWDSARAWGSTPSHRRSRSTYRGAG